MQYKDVYAIDIENGKCPVISKEIDRFKAEVRSCFPKIFRYSSKRNKFEARNHKKIEKAMVIVKENDLLRKTVDEPGRVLFQVRTKRGSVFNCTIHFKTVYCSSVVVIETGKMLRRRVVTTSEELEELIKLSKKVEKLTIKLPFYLSMYRYGSYSRSFTSIISPATYLIGKERVIILNVAKAGTELFNRTLNSKVEFGS